ncbi:hypothetical protein [Halobacillus salinus]|uniref:hypothetical protein n=1 Tax=Halobacillus salinus TaxID=192814 RepID=UPI00158FEDC7|nr:hypothetical protein [Halobacillus salinus]
MKRYRPEKSISTEVLTMKKYSKSGTDIEDVKKRNTASGLSYNQVKQKLAESQKQK